MIPEMAADIAFLFLSKHIVEGVQLGSLKM
jgi:hypothetical protein